MNTFLFYVKCTLICKRFNHFAPQTFEANKGSLILKYLKVEETLR